MQINSERLSRMLLLEFLFVCDGVDIGRPDRAQYEIRRQTSTRYEVYDFEAKRTMPDLTLGEVLKCISQ